MGYIICSKCKVTSVICFTHFGLRICGDAQLVSCSHLVDHTSIILIFSLVKGFLSRDKNMAFYLCITSFDHYYI